MIMNYFSSLLKGLLADLLVCVASVVLQRRIFLPFDNICEMYQFVTSFDNLCNHFNWQNMQKDTNDNLIVVVISYGQMAWTWLSHCIWH